MTDQPESKSETLSESSTSSSLSSSKSEKEVAPIKKKDKEKEKDKETEKEGEKDEDSEKGRKNLFGNSLRQSIGRDLRKSLKMRQEKKERTKQRKEAKANKRETNDYDLDDMEIVDVSNTSDNDENGNRQTLQRQELPFFDFMPDEVCLNICAYLSELEATRMTLVCKRFASLLNESSYWEEKAKGWVYLQVTKAPKGADLLNHYINYYKKNLDVEKRRQLETKNAALKRDWERRKKKAKRCLIAYWSLVSLESLAIFALMLLTIFIALRLDDVIQWNYHVIFLPCYIVMGHIFFAIWSTDCAYSYFNADRTYAPNDQTHFTANSTNIIIYNELTPIQSHYRGKLSTYVWWSTILSFFVLLAESLNNEGLFASYWCLVAILAGCVLLGCCFGSFRKNGKFITWEKSGVACGVSILVMTVAWFALFIWAKAEFLADFNWYAALSPWWITALCCLGILIGSWLIYIFDTSHRMKYAALLCTATIAYITICAFLVLLSINLENLFYDLPTYPWIVVVTPLIIFECFSMCACMAFCVYLNN